MPRRPHAAGCVVNTLSNNLSTQYNGIWVSDALLSETLRRFCHGSRRYGSNTPGPLESRRRSSKRKNASLAYVGAAPNVYDPSIMLGTVPKNQWWKDPRSRETPANLAWEQGGGDKISILPSWLSNVLSPENKSASNSKPIEVANLPEVESDVDMKELELDLQYRLARTNDLGSIKEAIQDLEPNFKRYPELSKVVFRHLLRIDGGVQQYEQVASALLDYAWNPPGSSNFLFVLQHVYSNRIFKTSWTLSLCPALLKSIESGLVPAKDLKEITSLLPKIHHTMLGSQSKSLTNTMWLRLLTVIEQSEASYLPDLDKSFLKTLYQQINSAPSIDDDTLHLLWRLRTYAEPTDLDLAAELIVKRAKVLAETSQEASEKLVEWFASVDKDLQGAVLIQATLRMLELANADSLDGDKVIKNWSTMLPQLYPRNSKDFPINSASWAQASLTSCTLSRPQQMLSVIWVAATLHISQHCLTPGFTGLGMEDDFKTTFTSTEGTDDIDTISQLIISLDTLPLPDKERVFRYLQHFSNDKFIKMLGHELYKDGLLDCFRNDYIRLNDRSFTSRARFKFPQVIQAICESTNADLRKFQFMAQVLILRNRDYFPIVWRLLNDNMEFRLALSQSWPGLRAKREKATDQGSVDPEVALNIVEQLTMTFAITPVISPKAAFKKVHKLYLFLHKVGAPINPVVARALWHAGVTRYGEKGAPNTQVKWCLQKVKEIEGQEAANRLLCSAGYRKDFLQEFARRLERDRRLLDSEPTGMQDTDHHDGYLKRRKPPVTAIWEQTSPSPKFPGRRKTKTPPSAVQQASGRKNI